jgi:hypothetical protein
MIRHHSRMMGSASPESILPIGWGVAPRRTHRGDWEEYRLTTASLGNLRSGNISLPVLSCSTALRLGNNKLPVLNCSTAASLFSSPQLGGRPCWLKISKRRVGILGRPGYLVIPRSWEGFSDGSVWQIGLRPFESSNRHIHERATMRTLWFGLIAVGMASGLLQQARAGLNDSISFSQAGTVTLALDASSGGFDHILELADTAGPVGPSPLLALTDVGDPSADVLGHPPASLGAIVSVGSFAAGEEIGFRLTNVESARLGTPGVIGAQIFSGSASSLNPTPSDFYTYVDFVNATTIKVFFEDVFGIPPTDPDPVNAFLTGGYDVAFTLTLVPEPSSLVLALGAALAVFWRRR